MSVRRRAISRLLAFRRVEALSWAAGLALLGIWATGRLVGNALEQRDLHRFEFLRQATTEAVATQAPNPQISTKSMDQTLWAAERVRAYERALKVEAPPALGVLRISRIGLEVPILPGTEEWTLDRAVGWIQGTARPGEPGNVGIAGHRDGFFRALKDVKPGDTIELATLGAAQIFRIETIRIVSPNDVAVLTPTLKPTLTLVTCFPFYFVGPAPDRYVVRATLASDRSSPSP